MKTSLPTTLFSTFFLAAAVGLFSVPVTADELVPPVPGGNDRPVPGDDSMKGDAGGAIIRDKECAKKHFKGKMLNAETKNPAYEKCVKDKLESATKKGDH